MEGAQIGQAASGIAGLDDILCGGFARGSLFLVKVVPARVRRRSRFKYLLDGAAKGESGLYVTLSETKLELLRGAASHGWTSRNPSRSPSCNRPTASWIQARAQSLLYSSDLELGKPSSWCLPL